MCFYGDMLFIIFVISMLKQNYFDVKIDVFFYQNIILILLENLEINVFYGISNKGVGIKEKIKNVLLLIKKLCVNLYDLVVNFIDQWSVVFIVCFLNVKIKILQDFGNCQFVLWKKSFMYLVFYVGEYVVECILFVLKLLVLKQYVMEIIMSYCLEYWENM